MSLYAAQQSLIITLPGATYLVINGNKSSALLLSTTINTALLFPINFIIILLM